MRRLFLAALPLLAGLLADSAAVSAADKGMESRAVDQAIEQRIRDEFLLDPGIARHAIDIHVRDGTVRLDGTVDNLLAQERAPIVAAMIRGVRSVADEIRVVPPAREAGKVRDSIATALIANPATRASEIAVSMADGLATLRGIVKSQQQKYLAAMVTRSIAGVTRVHNGIIVVYPGEREDAAIKAEVEGMLYWNPRLNHRGIEVRVANARVTLEGSVYSAREKMHAVADAWVTGVHAVQASALAVLMCEEAAEAPISPRRENDAALRMAVEKAIARHPDALTTGIRISAAGARVVLSGTVATPGAREAAERAARYTIGVIHVDNDLKVEPRIRSADEQLPAGNAPG